MLFIIIIIMKKKNLKHCSPVTNVWWLGKDKVGNSGWTCLADAPYVFNNSNPFKSSDDNLGSSNIHLANPSIITNINLLCRRCTPPSPTTTVVNKPTVTIAQTNIRQLAIMAMCLSRKGVKRQPYYSSARLSPRLYQCCVCVGGGVSKTRKV